MDTTTSYPGPAAEQISHAIAQIHKIAQADGASLADASVAAKGTKMTLYSSQFEFFYNEIAFVESRLSNFVESMTLNIQLGLPPLQAADILDGALENALALTGELRRRISPYLRNEELKKIELQIGMMMDILDGLLDRINGFVGAGDVASDKSKLSNKEFSDKDDQKLYETISRMKYEIGTHLTKTKELQEHCRSRGLSPLGSKDILIYRLCQYLELTQHLTILGLKQQLTAGLIERKSENEGKDFRAQLKNKLLTQQERIEAQDAEEMDQDGDEPMKDRELEAAEILLQQAEPRRAREVIQAEHEKDKQSKSLELEAAGILLQQDESRHSKYRRDEDDAREPKDTSMYDSMHEYDSEEDVRVEDVLLSI